MSKFQKVRGMHDVPLDQSSLWSEVIEKITHIFFSTKRDLREFKHVQCSLAL